MSVAAALAVCGLGHAYDDGTVALRDLSFKVDAGEAVAVIGGNGAGKSTLLLHLNGQLPATTGEVCVDGARLAQANLADVRRIVGLVFQDPDDQLFMPTVEDDVAFGPRNEGLAETVVAARVAAALDEVGATHLRDRPPHRLSGGDKRRVAIAGVLAMAPRILVLDEPSSGLDPQARRQLIRLLQGLGQTRIIATHDLDLALDVCTRAIVLHAGSVAADGPIGTILADAALLESCRLEPPLAMQGCPVCHAAEGNLWKESRCRSTRTSPRPSTS